MNTQRLCYKSLLPPIQRDPELSIIPLKTISLHGVQFNAYRFAKALLFTENNLRSNEFVAVILATSDHRHLL